MVLAGQFIVFGLILGIQGVIFAEVMVTLALSEGAFGTSQLALPLVGIVVLVFNGRLYTRWGNKRQSTVSVALLGAGMLVLAGLDSLPGFIVVLVLSGLGFAMLDAATSSAIMDVEQATDRHLMNIMHGLQSGSIMLGAFVTGFALAGGVSRRSIAVLSVLLLCLPVILLTTRVRFIPPNENTGEQEQESGGGGFLRKPLFAALAGICFLGSAAEAIAVVWTVVYMRYLEASIAVSGLTFALFNGAMLIGRFLNAAVVTKLGAPASLLMSGIGITASGVPLLASPGVPVAMAAFVVLGLSVAGVQPTALSASAPLSPNTGAVAAAIMMSAYLALLVAPVSYGWIAESVTLRSAMLVVALCGLLAVVLSLGAVRLSRRDKDQPKTAAGHEARTQA